MRNSRKGIMLITTLLILSLLTAMTVGFVEINRSNLQLASNLTNQEQALEAAYAGIQYAQMRFAMDKTYGNDGAGGWSLRSNCPAGGCVTNASTGFSVYERPGVAVGILSGGMSHFQIHFGATMYSDGLIAANPNTTASWGAGSNDPSRQSCNNFPNSGGCSGNPAVRPPIDSAVVFSIGYAGGVTRVVEALLQEVAYVNSSVQAAGDISVVLPAGCNGQGDHNWHITSTDPLYNNIRAGIKSTGNPSKPFANVGGNITGPSGFDASSNLPNQVTFSDANGAGQSGAAYALISGNNGGVLTVGNGPYGGSSKPQNIDVNVSNGSGFLEANSNNTGNLPTKDIQASDILNQVAGGSSTDLNGLSIPSNNKFFVPSGIWAFARDGGKGDILDVYDFNGNLIQEFKGDVKSGGTKVFTVNNYQLQIKPGINAVVDNQTYTPGSDSGKLGTFATQVAQGNFMVTLSPTDFTNSNMNNDGSNNVLPTLALDYQGTNQMGSSPSSITIGGNLYVQGQMVGSGAVVVQSKDSAGWNSSWSSTGTFSNSWASAVVSASAQGQPAATDSGGVVSGNIAVEGNSQISATANKSVAIYADNTAEFNPIPTVTANQTSSADGTAYYNSMNSFANGSNGSGGWWTGGISSGVGQSLNNFLQIDDDHYPALLRTANNGGGAGLDSGNTGKSAAGIFGATTSDANLISFLGLTGCVTPCAVPSANLNLYQYTQLRQYQVTGDTSWLRYSRPASGDPDPVEQAMLSQIRNYANQVWGSNFKTLGTYMYNGYGGVSLTNYSSSNMTFQGLIYVKGKDSSGNGLTVNPNCYQFTSQGALVTTQGNVNVSNAGQVTFQYDPTQIFAYIPDPNGGYETRILWLTLW